MNLHAYARLFPRLVAPLAALAGTPLAKLLAAACIALAGLPAQPCPNFGSLATPAHWTASPVSLGCAGAPEWPQWHLFTPWHRAPHAHSGFTPGDAHALPVLLISYHCTGLLFVPVLPNHVRPMGYVIDQPEYACTTPMQ